MVSDVRSRLAGSCKKCGKPLASPASPMMVEFCAAVARITVGRGRPPSWQELADAIGISFATAIDYGGRFRKVGVVAWNDGEPYSIRVVKCGGRCR